MKNARYTLQKLTHVFHADEPLGAARGTGSLAQGDHLKELTAEEIRSEIENGTIQVEIKYHAPGQTDADNIAVSKVDPNKVGHCSRSSARRVLYNSCVVKIQGVTVTTIST